MHASALQPSFVRACIACALGALAALVIAPAFALDPAPEAATGRTEKAAATSRRFMVAAANPLAVDAGCRILAAGGSAVDAAIAVQLVLNLVEPQSSGIGGGAFLLVHDARRDKLFAYDGRETAPAAATPERFLDAGGRPMEFRDAIDRRALGRRAGRRRGPRDRAPAPRQAAVGAIVRSCDRAGEEPASRCRRDCMRCSSPEGTMRQPRARDYFFDANGRPLAVGTIRTNPAFAATLERIAAGGARAFYEGDDRARHRRDRRRRTGRTRAT